MKTNTYLFLSCSFSTRIWFWQSFIFYSQMDISLIQHFLVICDRGMSRQYRNVILTNIVFTINTIWHCRNEAHFGKSLAYYIVINIIIVDVSLSENHTSSIVSNSIEFSTSDFQMTYLMVCIAYHHFIEF